MRTTFRRITGFALVVASIAGLIFSLAGIIGIWQIEKNLTASLIETVNLLDTTLSATGDGLTVVNESLTKATLDIDSLGATLLTTGKAIHDTNPLIDEISSLVARDLPDMVSKTQTALISAQASARIIEGTLTVISNIPLLPLEPYNPPVPLETALGEVVTSMDSLPDSLATMEETLNTSQGNLTQMEAEFSVMATQVRGINNSLTDAQVVITQYQIVVSELHDQIISLQKNLPVWLRSATWFITFALIWLALTQLGLLSQGLEMIARRDEAPVVSITADEVTVN